MGPYVDWSRKNESTPNAIFAADDRVQMTAFHRDRGVPNRELGTVEPIDTGRNGRCGKIPGGRHRSSLASAATARLFDGVSRAFELIERHPEIGSPRRVRPYWKARVLKEEGTPPSGKRPTSWQAVLQAHSSAFMAADFLTTEVWTVRGLVTSYTVFVIELPSQRVSIIDSTPHPDDAFTDRE